jgi:glycerophosphoryl diester phosphodiesterase
MGAGAPPENTVAAVEQALRCGADGVEVDVRLTRDGVPVCVHDADLGRVAGLPWLVDRTVSQQLQHVRVGGTHPVATLRDVAGVAAEAGVTLVLDLKPAGPRSGELVRAVADALPARLRASTVVSSRDLAILQAAARWLPALPAALITGSGLALAEAVRRASRRGLDLHAHVHELLADAGTAQQAMSLGLVIRAWTVNRAVDAELLRVLGAAAVITDRPEELRPLPAMAGRSVGETQPRANLRP